MSATYQVSGKHTAPRPVPRRPASCDGRRPRDGTAAGACVAVRPVARCVRPQQPRPELPAAVQGPLTALEVLLYW